MAEVLDPTFAADFPSDEFRSAILSTMVMGTPNRTEEKAQFFWETNKEYQIQDRKNRPYSLTAATPVEDNTPDPVFATIAVEYIQRNPSGTALGEFDKARAVLTILDTEYANVEGADWVKLGGDEYDINYVVVEALFDVDVFTVHCTARSES